MIEKLVQLFMLLLNDIFLCIDSWSSCPLSWWLFQHENLNNDFQHDNSRWNLVERKEIRLENFVQISSFIMYFPFEREEQKKLEKYCIHMETRKLNINLIVSTVESHLMLKLLNDEQENIKLTTCSFHSILWVHKNNLDYLSSFIKHYLISFLIKKIN